jgi:ubiquinone/menaquinone biosynthesis C-methylase UbiE
LIEKIEILPVSLLVSERQTIRELQELASRLKLEFGWHYLLDISWIIQQLEHVEGKSIIDAGAGTGVMQWYLAEKGVQVYSVDRESRANLAPRFRRRFGVSGLRDEDLDQTKSMSRLNANSGVSSVKAWASDRFDQVKYELVERRNKAKHAFPGRVVIYNQDLADLADIDDDSIDAIVAVSSLEHNSPDNLERVVFELLRVLVSGGALIATLGASRDNDWYHEPSSGWCYSEETLRRIFSISPDTSSNYSRYDLLFEQLRSNKELKENLATFYFQSGDNGMPWGKWDPQYQPVGICKIKQETQVGIQ